MTELTHDVTLAEIVNRHPSLARQLEARDLDYCCGGVSTLEDACATKGLDVTAVLEELSDAVADDATGESDGAWATMGIVQLVDHLETTHHAYLWSELPRLEALMAKVAGVHGARHPELTDISDCLAAIRADLEPHLEREERLLFPMVRELGTADPAAQVDRDATQRQIADMLTEHDVVGELLRRLRTLTGGYTPPADGCNSYIALFDGLRTLEADTHLHVHKENNLLFPAVVAVDQRSTS